MLKEIAVFFSGIVIWKIPLLKTHNISPHAYNLCAAKHSSMISVVLVLHKDPSALLFQPPPHFQFLMLSLTQHRVWKEQVWSIISNHISQTFMHYSYVIYL